MIEVPGAEISKIEVLVVEIPMIEVPGYNMVVMKMHTIEAPGMEIPKVQVCGLYDDVAVDENDCDVNRCDDNEGESDRNLPSLEERTALRPKISTEASKTGDPPFSAWNSQLFTGLGCKLTEYN
ncbi:hypothetical protein SBOR_10025 [Sclerotinia borealis F-4128]|uniref:Uncharacterized protein n=1 Tax=Sclerotinia borealis (strain F-4128) TaxID=1432307 RepID=W9C3T1_SCLBF|nr:hypothetical protein SBOR_10025 [Sclerotinia borealis F-4128]